jgi:hypothetical protein
MIPPGDRAEATKSRAIEYQVDIAGVHHDIVGKLVLNDNIDHQITRRLREAPSHQILQAPQRRQFIAQQLHTGRREPSEASSMNV